MRELQRLIGCMGRVILALVLGAWIADLIRVWVNAQ